MTAEGEPVAGDVRRIPRAPRHPARWLVLLAVLALGGCATAPHGDPGDPFEPTNRALYAFNTKFNSKITLPIAWVYVNYVPGRVRKGVRNVLANVESPVTFANDVLQGEFTRAGETLARFVLNSIGRLGRAGRCGGEHGVPRHQSRFRPDAGAAMAWPRAVSGPASDRALDAARYSGHGRRSGRRSAVLRSGGLVAARPCRSRRRHPHALRPSSRTPARSCSRRNLGRSSLDPYATMRSVYRQQRARQIWGSLPPMPDDKRADPWGTGSAQRAGAGLRPVHHGPAGHWQSRAPSRISTGDIRSDASAPVLEPFELACQADPPGAGISGAGGAGGGRDPAEDPSSAGLRRRGAQPHGRPGPGGRGQGVPAPGRRLRGELRRVPSRQYPRHLPRPSADGGGADLCRGHAGGEGGPHRRPVRQAALRAERDARAMSTLPSYRGDIVNGPSLRCRKPHARSQPPAAGLCPVGGRRSIFCAPSPRAAMPICTMSIAGRSASSPAMRRASATRRWPSASAKRSTSWKPAASRRTRCRSCARPNSTPATKRCCWAMSRR